ncbi:MAG: S9 family peptidase, partial [Bacteroidota bacterium]
MSALLRSIASRAWLALLLAAPLAFAQTPLTPEDVARIQTVREAVISPDGSTIAYTLAVPRQLPDDPDGSAYTELHLVDVATGTQRPYIVGQVSVRALTWAPDGSMVTFLSRRAGDTSTSLYGISASGGEARRLLGYPTGIRQYAWNADGTRVAFVANEPRPAKQRFAPVVYEEELAVGRVHIATPASGVEPRVLDEIPGSALNVQWSAGSDMLAVTTSPTSAVDDIYMNKIVHIVNPDDGVSLGTIPTEGKLGEVSISPNGDFIALITSADRYDPKEGRLAIYELEERSLAPAAPDLLGHVSDIDWLDGITVRFVADIGVETQVQETRPNLTNRATLYEGEGPVFTALDVAANTDVTALIGQSPQHPPEVYVMEGDEEPRRLTFHNSWLAERVLGAQEVVRYTARDGLEIEGLLIRPVGEEEGEQYPLVLVVHGGPEAHYRNGWLTGYSSPGQMAAGMGMAAFYPNYRGSTGRGLAFSRSSQGDPAGAEFDDLVDGVDFLIDSRLVDSTRVAVTGGSYGGYATAWLTTRYSERFAAGVMFVGISNKVSKVGTTDIPNEEFFVHARKRPWEDWEFFILRSPIYHAGNGRTPLLIAHGEDDPRVNVGQSRELYRHL